MVFRFRGISPAPFRELFALDDLALAARGMRRIVADKKPGFPCRVSLEEAEPGERLILLAYEQQPAHSPYRASGPIFVREAVDAAYDHTEIPPVLNGRQLSLRAYDWDHMIIDADVVEGHDVAAALTRLFGNAATDYVHIHNAKRGCFSCRVERA